MSVSCKMLSIIPLLVAMLLVVHGRRIESQVEIDDHLKSIKKHAAMGKDSIIASVGEKGLEEVVAAEPPKSDIQRRKEELERSQQADREKGKAATPYQPSGKVKEMETKLKAQQEADAKKGVKAEGDYIEPERSSTASTKSLYEQKAAELAAEAEANKVQRSGQRWQGSTGGNSAPDWLEQQRRAAQAAIKGGSSKGDISKAAPQKATPQQEEEAETRWDPELGKSVTQKQMAIEHAKKGVPKTPEYWDSLQATTALLETEDKLEAKKVWKSGCSCAGEECDQTSGGCCVHECGSSR